MFATLLARTRVHSVAIALLMPIAALISFGPTVLREVNSLSAETLYCLGLSGLLSLLGACALLSLPRTADDIDAVVGTVQVFARSASRALHLGSPAQGLGLQQRRHRAI